jgi:hypothetical protein
MNRNFSLGIIKDSHWSLSETNSMICRQIQISDGQTYVRRIVITMFITM